MARPATIQRGHVHDELTAGLHTHLLASFADGETITRIRFTMAMSIDPAPESLTSLDYTEGWAIGWYVSSSPTGDGLNPFDDDGDDRWMWHEYVQMAYILTAPVTTWGLGTEPERSVRAQRKNVSGDTEFVFWAITATTGFEFSYGMGAAIVVLAAP
jgi:hypothetical protein